jgi:DNA polymerase-4
VHTVEELEQLTEDELVRLLGRSHGAGLFALARAQDDRRVEPVRETKSISVEDTYDTDHVDPRLLTALLERQAVKVTERLRKSHLSGRTVSIKVRLHDFSTLSRSATLSEPSDDARQISRVARTLLGELDTSGGVRLLGVGVSGLADWIQEDLFADDDEDDGPEPDHADGWDTEAAVAAASRHRGWAPGMDVVHEAHGRGWVWGSGRGVVTVRFETAETGPGRVLSFAVDDAALAPFRPPEE